MKSKLLKLVTLAFCTASCCNLNITAKNTHTIPETKIPNIIVTYDEQLNPNIKLMQTKESDTDKTYSKYDKVKQTKEEKMLEDALIEKINAGITNFPEYPVKTFLPKPIPGMTVIYGSDSYIDKVFNPDGSQVEVKTIHQLIKEGATPLIHYINNISENTHTIPWTMLPSIVTYDENLNPHIEKAQTIEINTDENYIELDDVKESKEDKMLEDTLIEKINEEVKDYPVYQIETILPEPVPGMTVIYGADGGINRIVNLDGSQAELKDINYLIKKGKEPIPQSLIKEVIILDN